MITTMASDTYDIDILSRSGMIWIIDPCYKLVLMGIMWYICEGLRGKFPRPTRLDTLHFIKTILKIAAIVKYRTMV